MKILNKKTTNNTLNTLRVLSVEAIAKANSGHPGIALGAAPIMYALFKDHINIDVKNTSYFNRDRFVMSAGHGSSLLYTTMILAGYNSISLKDLTNFRQINSKTAGHPEPSLIPGIEVATGPLGQGIAMSVGLAIAEKKLANMFNKYGNLIDHYTYCLHGDGCLQEGVAYEAIALAGKLVLDKLILLYDSNKIQLDSSTSQTTLMDTKAFFKSLGWNYLKVKNGDDPANISSAISIAKLSSKPTCIEICTTIGYGSDLAGTNACHGSPLNAKQITELKKKLNYNFPEFKIPNDIEEDFTNVIKTRGQKHVIKFNSNLNKLEQKDIELYNKFIKISTQKLEIDLNWYKDEKVKENESTRNIMGSICSIAAKHLNAFMLGSADLSSSTKIGCKELGVFQQNSYGSQNIAYGVREFAMADIVNGINVHGGMKAVGSTFLSFSDYCKAAIRLAAISEIPAINVFSHDSITVGEDGPTHQPIEQISSLRLIPNHCVFRPCNYYEALIGLLLAFKSEKTPYTFITSRAEFKQIPTERVDLIAKGAYPIIDQKKYNLTIIATGSEVAVAATVAENLKKYDIIARIVSMPCMELFDKEPIEYKEKVLGNKPIISIEYGSTHLWYKYADLPIGIDVFGRSGKPNDVVSYFDLDPSKITMIILNYLKENKRNLK